MADETKTATVPANNLTSGPANVPGGVMSLEPGTVPGKPAVGSPLPPEDLQFAPIAEESDPAAARIRAFENKHLGVYAVRINDKIERGSGSPFAALSDEHKRQYAALEKLVAAEQKLADAHAALIQADVEHDAALAAAEPAPRKGPTVEEWVGAGYRAVNYPPGGYESRSTREEIDAAIAKQEANAGK